jgi:Domain of unknown function (DUF4105)
VRPRLSWLSGWIGCAILVTAVLSIGAWCSIAIWFRFPTGDLVRGLLSAASFAFTLVTLAFIATRKRWFALAAYFGFFALVVGWWTTIKPTNNRNWAPDVVRTSMATIDGDRLMVDNVRNFAWRSDTDFDQRWERRTYRLSHVTDVDLIMSYWAGEAIAHTIVSFGFDDHQRLAFSIETRKERHEGYSSVAGFFKQYELAIVAADERDVVRVRSNVRGEDVRIYRLRMTPENAQALLREYAAEIDDLAQHPRFYDTLTANCTNLVFDMVRVIHPGLPMDVRILLSGYLPNYAYNLGATDTTMSFDKLRKLSKIHDRAVEADADPRFSVRIREGIPAPSPTASDPTDTGMQRRQ